MAAGEDHDVLMREMREFDNYIGKVLTDATDDETDGSEHSASREVSVGEFVQSVIDCGAGSLKQAYKNAVPNYAWLHPSTLRKQRNGGEKQRRKPDSSPLAGLFSLASNARRRLDLARSAHPPEATNPQSLPEDGPPPRLARRSASHGLDEAPAKAGREHSWPWREGSQHREGSQQGSQHRKAPGSARPHARRRSIVVPTEMLFSLAYYNWMGKNNHFTEICCSTDAGSYLRFIDSCITHVKAQGPSRTCNESKEEEEEAPPSAPVLPSQYRTEKSVDVRPGGNPGAKR